MIRRPPSPTLFPSTPLSRPQLLGDAGYLVVEHPPGRLGRPVGARDAGTAAGQHDVDAVGHGLPESAFHRLAVRSEEHTSELQSQSNLVCRLLPAKKTHSSAT